MSLDVLHITTHDHGGAGRAAMRLHEALLADGVRSAVLVLSRRSSSPLVGTLPPLPIGARPMRCLGRDDARLYEAATSRWAEIQRRHPSRSPHIDMFTEYETGVDLRNCQEFREAETIHLHWTGGLLDIPSMPEVFAGKKVVWTLHDMAAFTGGCHYDWGCGRFDRGCGSCPLLGEPTTGFAADGLQARKVAYAGLPFTVTTPSRWLSDTARTATVLSGKDIRTIPNTLPVDVFRPKDRAAIRARLGIPPTAKVVLFGCDGLANTRKGLAFVLKALEHMGRGGEPPVVCIFGGAHGAIPLPPGTIDLGSISDEDLLADAYAMADVFAIPSLQDNLPNTILESLSCGTPVAGFRVGGIPDMVEHGSTGHLAEAGDSEGLARSIAWVLEHSDDAMRGRARETVVSRCAPGVLSAEFRKVYAGLAPMPAVPVRAASAARDPFAPEAFERFSVSRTAHFREFATFLGHPAPDLDTCDLKAYQDHLVLSFIRANIPRGARILEVGGGASRVLAELRGEYECWNLEPFEGVGSGPVQVQSIPGVRLVRDYLGSFHPDLPTGGFQLVFSISTLEHVPEDEAGFAKLLADIERLLAPGAWSLHCFDCVVLPERLWTNGFVPWLYRNVPDPMTRWVGFEEVRVDPDLYHLRQAGYERHWMPATRTPWNPDERAFSANMLWRKAPAAPARLPRISMVVPSYNQGAFLEAALRSILDQGYPDLQLVVMDGGSTDGSVDIIRRHADRLHHWRSAKDGGQYRAIEEGFALCDGEIMGWLNSDDILHPFSLWKLAKLYSERPEVEWTMGRPTAWDGAGRLVDVLPVRTWERGQFLSGDFQWIQQESTFWRRSLYEKAGGRLDTSLRLAGDLELWTRFFRHARLQVVDGLVGGFRRHGDQKTSHQMDAYLREAAVVLDRERSLVAGESDPFLPRAPEPVRIEDVRPPRLLGHGWRARLVPGTRESLVPWLRSLGRTGDADELERRMARWVSPGPREVAAAADEGIDVTAVVSVYQAESFLRGCLDDLLGQTLWTKGRLEIIVVDTGSPQGESDIVREYQRRHGQDRIRLVRTEDRRSLYAAWNLGTDVARGRHVTNANADDAHLPDALETMARALDETPEADFCFADHYLTTVPNDRWTGDHHDRERISYPGYHPATSLLWCTFGPHPMWRRSVFALVGGFDESFRSAGDHEFQIRLTLAGCRGVHLPRALSLFYQNPEGLSQSGTTGAQETERLCMSYWTGFPLERLYRLDLEDAKAVHAAWLDLGHRALRCGAPWAPDHSFPVLAFLCFAEAEAIDPSNPHSRSALVRLALVLKRPDLLPERLRPSGGTHVLPELEGPRPDAPPPAVPPLRWIDGARIADDESVRPPARVERNVPLHWCSPILNFSGYARMNRDLVRSLDRAGFHPSVTPMDSDPNFANALAESRDDLRFWMEVLQRPETGEGVFVCSHLPPGFPAEVVTNPAYRVHVGLTMFETDRLPNGWARACASMDEIWVPSTFNRETFARGGLDPSRIQVVPYGIDLSRWNPSAAPMDIPGRRGTNLLAVFEWTRRKGWDVLVEAFARAFGPEDDVSLTLRTRRPANDPTPIRAQIDAHLRSRGLDPRRTAPILLLEEPVPDAAMPSLYAACDAVVLPTRGEGWGLPFMEALAMERPVVATAWGAHMDFLDDQVGWTIPVEGLETVDPEQTRLFPLYGADHLWAKPSLGALVDILGKLPGDRELLRAKGRAGRARLAADWTPERSALWIRRRTEHLLGKAESAPGTDKAPPASSLVPAAAPLAGVMIRAGFCDFSGYSRLARDTALTLRDGSLPLRIEAFASDPAFLRELEQDPGRLAALKGMVDHPRVDGLGIAWFPPTQWEGRDVYSLFREWNPQLRRHVAMTMFETDRISPEWASHCNGMDEIWVPSTFNLETFANSGVDRHRLRVIPLGIRMEDYDPARVQPMLLAGRADFTFLSVFQWTFRKGWDLLLEAFAREFAHDEGVRLVLRTYPSGRKDPPIRQRIDAHLASLGLSKVAGRIQLVEEFVSDARMPSLLAAGDAFVLPTRGEGWGIPFLEAMALGKPVIATRWSGHLEFMNDANSFLVDVECLENVQEAMREDNDLYTSDHRWAKPSLKHLRARMREVFSDPAAARRVGEAARRDVLRERDISRTANWIRERAKEISQGSGSVAAPAAKAKTADQARRTIVAVDARALFDRDSTDRGIGHYAHNHLKALEQAAPDHEFLFLGPDDLDESLVREHLETGRVRTLPLSRFRPGMADRLHLVDPMGERPDGISPFSIAFSGPRTTVFYDLIPLRYYLQHWSDALRDQYLQRLEQAKAFDGTHLCISEATRGDLVACGVQSSRTGWIGAGLNRTTSVVPPSSAQADDLLRRLGVDGPFFLHVGALDAHKNFQATLSCFLAVRERVPCQLVVVGRRIHSLGAWARTVEDRGIGGVVFTDFLSREDLEALYSRAASLLFLSRIEGFGFPLLEAMAQGCPAIAYANSSLPEVGGDAALLVPDNDEVAVVKSMLALLADPGTRQELSKRGRARAAGFTWAAVARRTLEAWGSGSGSAAAPSARSKGEVASAARSRGGDVPVLWGAPVFDPSGYADEARGFLKSIAGAGISVALREAGRSSPTFRAGLPSVDRSRLEAMLKTPAVQGSTAVVHLPAHGFQRIPGCGRHVGRTMFETDSLPPSWVEACNGMDEIWVPTDFNLRTFREAGVRVPLLKVPGGVDSDRFRPGLEALALPGPRAGTTYLSVFEWTARKGWDVLLKGWARAFKPSDDVRLVLRAYPPNAIEGDPAAWVEGRIDAFLASIGTRRDRCAPILVLASQIPDAEMPRLYAAADVYLAPSRGEGWGRPHMEAMSSGVPVVATRWSGNLEFQDDDNSWLIDVDRVGPVGDDMAFEIYRGQNWAEPSLSSFVELLGRSWKNRSERAAKAARARKDVVERWDWRLVAPRAAARLKEIAEGIPAQASALREADREPAAGIPAVRWCGPLFNYSGYARLAREAVSGLVDAGADVTADPLLNDPGWFAGLRDDAVSIRRWKTLLGKEPGGGVLVACDLPRSADGRHDVLAEMARANPGCSHRVVWTMFETDRLPTGWAESLNRMDQVWVPSRHGFEAFARSGVDPSKLRVVPGGIDPRAYDPASVGPRHLPGRAAATTFLSVFQWNRRKGWDVLLRAWSKAFQAGDDVRLVLRCHGSGAGSSIRDRLSDWLVEQGLSFETMAPVIFLDDFVPEPEMPGLYAAADVFVLPTRGEGWGLPFLEAMASGKPCIATAWGGQTDFLHEGVAWMLPVPEPVAVDAEALRENPFLTAEHRWADPQVADLVSALRAAQASPVERRRRGERARADVLARWTSAHTAQAIASALGDLVPPRIAATRSIGNSRLSGMLAAVAEGLMRHPAPVAIRAAASEPPPRTESGRVLAIRWEGSQFVHHSLAHVNRELCLGLAKAGHDLSLIPYEPDQFGPGDDPDLGILASLANAPLEGPCQVHVRHQWPPNLKAPGEGRWIVIQPWEFGSPPREWIAAWRDSVDDLWAYTDYVRDMYLRAGMPPDRVHVVPLGVDCDRFRPGLAPLASLPAKKGVRFLYVGGTIARKGFDVLLNAWQKAFGPDDPVELLIKDMGGKTTYAGQTGESYVRKIQESGRFATIHYRNEDLAPSELPALYASGDVLVHPYRGEGFGLPIAEAMACGLPVVITRGGSADDFCGADEAWMIPSTRKLLPDGRVGDTETVEPAWWLEPSEEALIAALREAALDAGSRESKGRRARERIVGGFTWAHAVAKAQDRLALVASRPVRRRITTPTVERPVLPGLHAEAAGIEADLEGLSLLLLQVEGAVSRQELAEAETLSRMAVETHPDRPVAWLTRAMVLRALGKHGKALEALTKAGLAGGGPEVIYETMALHLQTGKTGPALVQWKLLQEKHPAWVSQRKEIHLRAGQPWLPDRFPVHGKPTARKAAARKR